MDPERLGTLPVARHYRLIASEALFGRAGLDRRGRLGRWDLGRAARQRSGPGGPADHGPRAGRGVAAVVAFPNALAPAASRNRLLALIEVAVRAGVPVAVEAMAASHLLRRLAEEAAHGAPLPDTGFPPDAERWNRPWPPGAGPPGIPRPRVGFFGVVDERMDLDLVHALAELRPDWRFVMIGPVVKIDPDALPRSPNLHWLGVKSYAELPAYLSGWDAGFMPFARNESTRFISPTKTPEFLAAGLPVVSTPVADVVSDWGGGGLVDIAGDAPAFADALGRALDRPRAGWLRDVDRRLAEISWDRTWDGMRLEMSDATRVGAASGARAAAASAMGESA
jgi:glycosyltransferase involved in cell wall biosynthesis